MSTGHPAGSVRRRGTGLPERGAQTDDLTKHITGGKKKANGRYMADLWNHLEKKESMKMEDKASKK